MLEFMVFETEKTKEKKRKNQEQDADAWIGTLLASFHQEVAVQCVRWLSPKPNRRPKSQHGEQRPVEEENQVGQRWQPVRWRTFHPLSLRDGISPLVTQNLAFASKSKESNPLIPDQSGTLSCFCIEGKKEKKKAHNVRREVIPRASHTRVQR